jgi:hypothetical protein
MSFVPPIFGDLGKSASNLFKKKFDDKKDFKNVIKTTNKTASGLTFTTGGTFDSKNNLTGDLKAEYKKDNVEVVGDLSTAGPAKVDIKVKKLQPGLTLQLVGDTGAAFNPGKFSTATVKGAVEYSRDFFAGTASAESAFGSNLLLSGSGVIGFEGLSVGGEAQVDANKISDVEDYNLGAQYDDKDFTATLKTAKFANDLTGSYVHKVNSDLQVAGQFNTKLDGTDDRSAGLASEYKVDANTTVKLRGNTKKVVAVAVEHRLANPRLALGFASSWNLVGFSAPNPKDFGISLNFGDFDAK